MLSTITPSLLSECQENWLVVKHHWSTYFIAFISQFIFILLIFRIRINVIFAWFTVQLVNFTWFILQISRFQRIGKIDRFLFDFDFLLILEVRSKIIIGCNKYVFEKFTGELTSFKCLSKAGTAISPSDVVIRKYSTGSSFLIINDKSIFAYWHL